MYGINTGIAEGLKHIKCPICNKEISVIFGGLFGQDFKKVKKSQIKYISGCCYDKEYYYCDNCNKYFDEDMNEIK